MSYKPLSQTVTDGQKNPISSDAVNDHVAAEIAAIPASASLTLDNLTAPTAVNQDLLLDAGKKIRLNASETVNTLLHVKSPAPVSIGVNALTPSNTGSTSFNTSVNVSSLLAAGDYIKLNGLADIARVISINFGGTNITVSPALGIGGGGTSRDIEKIQTSATFRNSSNVEQFSIIDDKFKFASNIIFGNGAGNRVTGTNNILFGQNAGQLLTTAGDTVIIGTNAAQNVNHSNTLVIGGNAASRTTTSELSVILGTSAGRLSGLLGQSVIIGHEAVGDATSSKSWRYGVAIGWGAAYNAGGGFNIVIGPQAARSYNTAAFYGFNIALGYQAHEAGISRGGGAALTTGTNNTVIGNWGRTLNATDKHTLGFGTGVNVSSNNIAFGSVGSSFNTVYFGKGEYGIDRNGEESTAFKITTHKGRLTDQDCLGSLVLAGAAGTGTGLGSALILATAPASASSGTSVNSHLHRVRIEQDGRVGIGTSNPEAKLEVAGKVKLYDGDLEIGTLGKGLKIAEGADATVGVVTLAAGTATVNTAAVKSNSRIMLTNQNPGGTVGFLHVSARTADTSFVITSSNAADTSDVAWVIINPLTVTDSDADTFITNASITDPTQKRAVQRLVKSLKDESLWAKMKAIYPMVGGTEAAHKLNLKDPQDTDAAFRLTAVTQFGGASTVEHNSRGIKFGGSNNPVNYNTHLVPNTDFTSIADFHISCYMFCDDDIFRNGIAIGAGTTNPVYLSNNSAQASFRIDSTTRSMRNDITNFPTDTRPKNNFMLMNSTATSMRGYLRTLEKDLYEVWERSASAATGTLTSAPLVLNGYSNDAGTGWSASWTFGSTSLKTMQFVTIGDSLTTFEVYKLHAIIEQFQLELGRQV